MPAYPNITPDWADPKQASVLDSPIKKAVRALVGIMGGDDPAGQVMGVAGPLGTVTAGANRRISPLLEDIFTKNPAARDVYERAQTAQLTEMAPDVLGSLPKKQADALAATTKGNLALRGLLAGSDNVVPTPLASRTGFETAIPKNAPQIRRPNFTKSRTPGSQAAPGFESKFSVDRARLPEPISTGFGKQHDVDLRDGRTISAERRRNAKKSGS